MALKSKLRRKPKSKPEEPAVRPFVAPDPNEPKSGCFWCPLLPWSADFKDHQTAYHRDFEKIHSKEPDGHTVRSRNVSCPPWPEVDLLFVGEAPGAREDRKGEAFIGEPGKQLRWSIKKMIDLPEDRIAFTNTIRCRPPRNRNPGKTEVKCCSYELVREIQARKPKLLVVLGNYSMEYLTGQTGITTFHGRILKCTRPEFPDLDVLACLHPAYILRMDHMIEKWLEALELAGTYLKGEYRPLPGKGDYYVVDRLDMATDLLAAFREDRDIVAFDTETGSLTPFQDEFPHLLCFSFANEEGVGYTIPYDHPDSPWRVGGERERERQEITEALQTFFESDVPKIAQNEKFDRKHIRHALDVEPANVIRDTMLTHLLLDERRGTHGLKTLAFAFTGMGGYERPLEQYCSRHKAADLRKGGSYANVPGDLLFKYAAMDADVTLRVDNALVAQVEYRKNPKFQRLAEDFFPALSQTLADIEYHGALVDVEVVKELDVHYTGEMDTIEKKIERLPKIRKFTADQIKAGRTGKKKADPFIFNPGSTQQLRKVLFDYYGEKPVELTDAGFSRLVERHKQRNAKLNGSAKVRFPDIVQESVERKEWDYFTTKADVLNEYDRKGNELAPLILEYRGIETLHGTFIKPLRDLLDMKGCVHGSFNIFGTVTGRLSSSSPNLQNIPNKGEGRVKQVYVSRFGDEGVILQLDYSQIELRFAASWFNEPSMVNAYLAGADLHAVTAHDIAIASGVTERQWKRLNDHEKKAWRVRAKRINFAILYGGGPPALQASLKKEGVFVTIEECRELIDLYFQTRPKLKQGITKLEEKARKHGYLESFTGRRRRLPEVFSEDEQIVSRALRQSVNFPIQSGASDMTLMSLVLINRILRSEGFRSQIVLTVHDSIVFDCHVDEVIEVATIAKGIMENIRELSDDVLPGIDWSFWKVPIVADCEVGYSWGQMVAFDPETVDVDELWAKMAEKAA